MTRTSKETIKALTMFANDLNRLITATQKKRDKELEKATLKAQTVLEDYKDEDELHDAYGYGYITEKQFEEYKGILRDADNSINGNNTALTEYLRMLRRNYKEICVELDMIKKGEWE